jgi:hypothetical protein
MAMLQGCTQLAVLEEAFWGQQALAERLRYRNTYIFTTQ